MISPSFSDLKKAYKTKNGISTLQHEGNWRVYLEVHEFSEGKIALNKFNVIGRKNPTSR